MYIINTALMKNNDSALLVRQEKGKCVKEEGEREATLTQDAKGDAYD